MSSGTRTRQTGARRAIKRCIDVAGAMTALTLTSPVLAATAMAVRATLGSPVFFRQKRTGEGGRIFTVLKVRTMNDARDATGRLLPDEQRLTRVGRIVRGMSLDELPQLWNVLRGDMSLVGPRPLLPQYLDRYTPEQARRHEVMQGITGWAQINGRNALTHEQRFELDVWYVDHWSLLLDFKILALTVVRVFDRSKVNAHGHATMPEFMGTQRTQLSN